MYAYITQYFGSKLPKYRDCTTSNDFELYLMCCGVMLLLLIIYVYIYIHIIIIYITYISYVCILYIITCWFQHLSNGLSTMVSSLLKILASDALRQSVLLIMTVNEHRLNRLFAPSQAARDNRW